MPEHRSRVAAGNGHEGVVRILLERNDVDPDSIGIDFLTPLSQAAGNGHEGVVRILVERNDVNPDKAYHDARTPLWLAAENGPGGVVRILLEREMSILIELTNEAEHCYGGLRGTDVAKW